MKVKKQKRHRRAVRFYTACFGFREPFKILCDGTFVHHLLANRITPADTALSNTLGAAVKIFTTRCVLAELRSLGDSYFDSFNAARNLITARCDHEKRKSAVACITEVIGEKNPEHFFVATQDAELRKKFQEIPGVPVLYGIRNALFLDRPSTFQHEFARTVEEERSHMTGLEYKVLTVKKKNVSTDEARDSPEANEGHEDHILEMHDLKKNVERNRIDSKDKAQFKRKKAKGPNPLSCKKKKSQGNTGAVTAASGKGPNPLSCKKKKSQGNTGAATAASGKEMSVDNSTRSRSRKRKRSRKSKITTEPIAR